MMFDEVDEEDCVLPESVAEVDGSDMFQSDPGKEGGATQREGDCSLCWISDEDAFDSMG